MKISTYRPQKPRKLKAGDPGMEERITVQILKMLKR